MTVEIQKSLPVSIMQMHSLCDTFFLSSAGPWMTAELCGGGVVADWSVGGDSADWYPGPGFVAVVELGRLDW